MNAFGKAFSAAITLTLTTFALAQAPIVRQPPSRARPAAAILCSTIQPGQPPAPPNYDQTAQMAQQNAPPPAPLPPDQLDGLVNRIALYPDPLLAQVLTASTYWDEVPDAAVWAAAHSYLKGDALSAAIQADNLRGTPACSRFCPFPSVLDMMAGDPNWTASSATRFSSSAPT